MPADDVTIRSFQVDVPEDELTELRRRVSATRWPERETVADDSQGVRLALMQELARYWATDYDWRPCEAKLNALPNFLTTGGRRAPAARRRRRPRGTGRARAGTSSTGR